MTTLAEDFRTFLLSKSAITNRVGQRIHHNRVPETVTEYPRILYFRRQTITERATNETAPKPTMVSFDVEIVDSDLAAADALADTVRAAIDGYRGEFGSTRVKGVWVEDQDDDYVPRSNDSDKVDHIPSFIVEIRP